MRCVVLSLSAWGSQEPRRQHSRWLPPLCSAWLPALPALPQETGSTGGQHSPPSFSGLSLCVTEQEALGESASHRLLWGSGASAWQAGKTPF